MTMPLEHSMISKPIEIWKQQILFTLERINTFTKPGHLII